MSSEDSTLKISLCEAAADRWLIEPRFSLAELADSQGISLAQLLALFSGREAMLAGYYETRWIAFNTLRGQVPEYDGYSFEEKLSNLLYSLMELMNPHKTFVCRTWPRYLGSVPDARRLSPSFDLLKTAQDMWRHGFQCMESPFRQAFLNELRSLLGSSDVSRSSGMVMRLNPVLDLIWLAFLGILEYWCRDTSHDGEKTAALIDKWVALIGAIASSDIADKGVDLARFLGGDLMKQGRQAWHGVGGAGMCRCGSMCRCASMRRCGCDCGCCSGGGADSVSGADSDSGAGTSAQSSEVGA